LSYRPGAPGSKGGSGRPALRKSVEFSQSGPSLCVNAL
jgi:hypothetical protein